jgi:AcrR family transcriptional regulator
VAEKLTRERRREMTRVALLDAAVEVFAKRGFEGASLDEIAEVAGFTRGAIYKNFANKEELFFAVLDRADEQAFASFANAEQESPARLADTWQALMPTDTRLLALTLEYRLYALRSDDPQVRQRWRAEHDKTIERVRAFVEEGQRTGRVANDIPAEIPELLMAAAQGVSQQTLLDPDAVRLFEPFFALLLKALAPD